MRVEEKRCWTLHALNCHHFPCVTKGEGQSELIDRIKIQWISWRDTPPFCRFKPVWHFVFLYSESQWNLFGCQHPSSFVFRERKPVRFGMTWEHARTWWQFFNNHAISTSLLWGVLILLSACRCRSWSKWEDQLRPGQIFSESISSPPFFCWRHICT